MKRMVMMLYYCQSALSLLYELPMNGVQRVTSAPKLVLNRWLEL